MDWILVMLILTEAPNFTQSQSFVTVNFESEQHCTEAVKAIKSEMSQPTGAGAKVTVRATCAKRFDKRPR